MKSVPMMLGVALGLGSLAALAQEPAANAPTEKEQREEVRQEVGEAADAIRNYSVERRNDAVAQATRALEDADRRANQLQVQMNERWERMDTATRRRSQEAMADLRQRRIELAEWAGGMKHGSVESWGEVNAGFVRSYREFLGALENVRAKVGRDTEQNDPDDDKTSSQKQEQER